MSFIALFLNLDLIKFTHCVLFLGVLNLLPKGSPPHLHSVFLFHDTDFSNKFSYNFFLDTLPGKFLTN